MALAFGQVDQAVRDARELTVPDAYDGTVWISYGDVAARAGDLVDACPAYRRAVAFGAPYAPKAQLHPAGVPR
jgi:Flp pilus assembly protein TadD